MKVSVVRSYGICSKIKSAPLGLQTGGGYFCGLLLSLLPIAYPSPKAVRHKLMTAIRPSIMFSFHSNFVLPRTPSFVSYTLSAPLPSDTLHSPSTPETSILYL